MKDQTTRRFRPIIFPRLTLAIVLIGCAWFVGQN